MGNYLTWLTPLVAGIIATYAIFPDLFNLDPWRRVIAIILIGSSAMTSIWSAYSAVQDQKHLTAWQNVGAVHDGVHKIWNDFQQASFGPNRMDEGLGEINAMRDLIEKGQWAEATQRAQNISRFYAPDKAKLTEVIKEIDDLPNLTRQPGVSVDLKYRAFYFGITVKTLAWRYSKNLQITPTFLFATAAAEEKNEFNGQLTLTRQWSEFLWYTGYFKPADFAPPLRILSVDSNGCLIVDSGKFDDAFLFSRAVYLIDRFDNDRQ
jgi:hypothetical protein